MEFLFLLALRRRVTTPQGDELQSLNEFDILMMGFYPPSALMNPS
jgi:hypothetical protein